MGAAKRRGSFEQRRLQSISRCPPKPALFRGSDGQVYRTNGRGGMRRATATEVGFFNEREAAHTPENPGARLAVTVPDGLDGRPAKPTNLIGALAILAMLQEPERRD